jgi:hypothetical protein
MPSLPELANKPAAVTGEEDFGPWFARVASFLLNNTELVVGGTAFRIAELEAYYKGPGHYDLFAHADPVQLENGRWYFHRTRGEYRGGSFKGLDLAFGDGTAHFGILIRTVISEQVGIIDGPSLTVDHLLGMTAAGSVAELDAMIGARKLWDSTSPLFVRECPEPRSAEVFTSSRVGLSLKKAKGKPDAPRFVGKPYRYLTAPRDISKGKTHLVLALHRKGEKPEVISQTTRSPRKTVDRYIADFAAGKAVANFDAYIGKDLSTSELCKMLGTWAAKFGGEKPA